VGLTPDLGRSVSGGRDRRICCGVALALDDDGDVHVDGVQVHGLLLLPPDLGARLLLLKYFLRKLWRKWRFLLKLLQKINHNIGFEKNANFFTEN
jgi:hypothetical protein